MKRRFLTDPLEEALVDTPVVAVVGARQTGKTTLVRDVVAKRPGAKYFTLDDPTVMAAASADPSAFVRQAGDGLLIVDEVQKAPALMTAIKVEVDRDRRPGRCLLTGSAHVLALPQISDSLAGRMEILQLRPFSQREADGGEPTGWIDRVFDEGFEPPADLPDPAAELAARVLGGGYPEVGTRAPGRRRTAWFDAYVTAILQRDIRDIASIEGLTQVPRLLALLAARSASLLNKAELSRGTGIAYTTLDRYLALLEATFLIEPLPAWASNLGKRLTKSPKVVLGDSGLAAHLMAADARRWRDDPRVKGALTETFVVGELRKMASWAEHAVSLYHYRAGRHEVDVVLEDAGGNVVGIEVKAGATLSRHDGSGLRTLAESLGNRFRRGFALYAGQQVTSLGRDIWAVPLSVLWEPSGSLTS